MRPRPAASLVLLRVGAAGPEVLLGRRGGGARFMPGVYVFPGGRVHSSDTRPWLGEAEDGSGRPPLLRRFARAALRETFEETGLLIGRPAAASVESPRRPLTLVEEAYRSQGLAPALDALRPVGRAITPNSSPVRFHARFFLADGSLAVGAPQSGEELEDLGWYGVEGALPPLANVTRFMLERAIEAWRGGGSEAQPLFRYYGGRERITMRRRER